MNDDLSYENRDGVHIFTWHKSSYESVDKWLDILRQVALEDETVGYMLLDLSDSGLLPIRYVMKEAYKWLKEHPQEREGCNALVFRSGDAILPALRALSLTLMVGRDAKVRFFSKEDYDKALAWLQEEKATVSSPDE